MAAHGNSPNNTLFVKNIPLHIQNKELYETFKKFGPIKKCFVLLSKNPTNDGTRSQGSGYVTFQNEVDAHTALNSNVYIKSRELSICIADSNVKKRRIPAEKRVLFTKEAKKDRQRRKARVIIRNLSFKVTEEQLKQIFGKFGEIVELSIAKDKNGLLRGFAFIQFSSTKSAIKAVNALNFTDLKGRKIAVDFAVAKDKYDSRAVGEKDKSKDSTLECDDTPGDTNNQNKSERTSHSYNNNKVVFSSDEESENEGAFENSDEDETVADKAEKSNDWEKSASNDSAESSEEESNNEKASSTDSDDEKSDSDESDSDSDEQSSNRKRKFSSDEVDSDDEQPSTKRKKTPRVKENLSTTLFIRNLVESVTQEELQAEMIKFGPIKYCLICTDEFTNRSKGSAFVRFMKADDAKKCLEHINSTGIELQGEKILAMHALSKDDIHKQQEAKLKKVPKDKRNLFLAREGMIRAGTAAAEGVSPYDLQKRISLEVRKRKALQNLHNFVSDCRLAVHNLPKTCTDKQLRKIFYRAANSKDAVITEARVMRDLRKVDENGKGVSRGFGFVTFTKHEHALTALREVNNNPTIFTASRRPIVEFSIENKAALLIKEKRRKHSLAKLKQMQGQEMEDEDNKKEVHNVSKESKPFQGFESKPEIKNFPSHVGAKIRTRKGRKGKQMKGLNKPKKEQKRRLSRNEKQKLQRFQGASRQQIKDAKDEARFTGLLKKYNKI